MRASWAIPPRTNRTGPYYRSPRTRAGRRAAPARNADESNQILGDTYRAELEKSLFGPVVQANIAASELITPETYATRRPMRVFVSSRCRSAIPGSRPSPCGFNSGRLPIGLQIVANDFQERLLFRIAAAFEEAIGFHDQQPPIYCG